MNCCICGGRIDTAVSYSYIGDVKLVHHDSCDPYVAKAKVSQVLARPLNVKKYKQETAASGIKSIEDNIISEI